MFNCCVKVDEAFFSGDEIKKVTWVIDINLPRWCHYFVVIHFGLLKKNRIYILCSLTLGHFFMLEYTKSTIGIRTK